MQGALFIVLVFAAMWAVVILPQQRQLRRHKALVASLAVGDEVVTTSGIYGTVTALDESSLRLRVAEGVELRLARQAIGERVVEATAPDAAGTPTRPLEA